MIKYAVFNVLNRFQTYSNSIDCTVTMFNVSLCKFFFRNVACANFFLCPFGALQMFFLQILPLPPSPPRDQLVRPLLFTLEGIGGGEGQIDTSLDFFGFKFLFLDRLPKALVQLFFVR